MNRIFKYIDDNRSLFIDELRELIRQPSISATGEGVKECAELLRQMMERIGIESRVIETDLHPIVFGEIKSRKNTKTMLLGAHYDVVPVEPISRWTFEPFGAIIKDGRIYGREATDCKGNVIALLKA